MGGGSARMRVGSYVKKSHATAAANKEHEKLEITEIIDTIREHHTHSHCVFTYTHCYTQQPYI